MVWRQFSEGHCGKPMFRTRFNLRIDTTAGIISFKGFSDMLGSFKSIGLMSVDEESRIQIENWADLVPAAMGKTLETSRPSVFLSPESLLSGLRDVMPGSRSVESTLAALSE